MPMINFRTRKFAAHVVLGLALTPSFPAFATCWISEPTFVPQDIALDMGRVVVPAGLAVGAVIKELGQPIVAKSGFLSCTPWYVGFGGGAVESTYANARQHQTTAIADVFQTDVPGVGVRVLQESQGNIRRFPFTRYYQSASDAKIEAGQLRIQLVKTSERTGSGPIAAIGQFVRSYANYDGAAKPILTGSLRGAGITIVSSTCQVQAGSRNVVVDMGGVAGNSFSGVGSRSSSRDFEIILDCQGDSAHEAQSRIGIRLDSNQDSSNFPGVLPINTGSNSATGIGIEIVRREGGGEREVIFGQTIGIGSTTPGASTLALPLRARYIQTQPGSVGPGLANGQATFTIQYE